MAEKTQALFKPETAEELIKGWLLHAHTSRDRHDLTARQFDRLRYVLGFPTTILAVIVGSSVFASLETEVALGVTILVASMSILSAILASLQTFFNYPERAEGHRIAGVKYKGMIRELEQMLALKTEELDVNTLDELRRRFDALEAESPVVPPSIVAQVKATYDNVKFKDTAVELYRSSRKDAQVQ